MIAWINDGFESRQVWPHRVTEGCIRLHGKITYFDESGSPCFECIASNEDPETLGSTSVLPPVELFGNFSGKEDGTIKLSFQVCFSLEKKHDTDALLPLIEDGSLVWYLGVTCKETKIMLFKTLEINPSDSFPFVKDLEMDLPLGLTSGQVDVEAFVLLQRDLNPDTIGFDMASKKGSILATGHQVKIQIDQPEKMHSKGIDIQWLSFRNNKGAEFGNGLFFLEIDETSLDKSGEIVPTIYFNDDFNGLRPLVNHKGRGSQSKARDAMFSLIATNVWTQFALYCKKKLVTEDLEEPDQMEPGVKLARRLKKQLIRKGKLKESDFVMNLEGYQHEIIENLSLRLQVMTEACEKHDRWISSGIFPSS